MQNILKRPMFRKGGLTQRENYERGTEPEFILGENPNKDAFFPGIEQRMKEMGMGAGGGRDMSGIQSIKISDLIEKPKKEMPPARKAPRRRRRIAHGCNVASGNHGGPHASDAQRTLFLQVVSRCAG